MPSSMVKIVGGFIAGALAVLIFHQGMYVLIQQLLSMKILGAPPLGGTPWNFSADPGAYGLPRVLNQAFWGGLWGIVFAYMIDVLPGPNWLRGFVFGCVFPMLLGSWLLVPLIKANMFGIVKPPQVLFSGALEKGFDIMRLRNGFLLNGVAFGIGLGLLFPFIANMMSGRNRH